MVHNDLIDLLVNYCGQICKKRSRICKKKEYLVTTMIKWEKTDWRLWMYEHMQRWTIDNL